MSRNKDLIELEGEVLRLKLLKNRALAEKEALYSARRSLMPLPFTQFQSGSLRKSVAFWGLGKLLPMLVSNNWLRYAFLAVKGWQFYKNRVQK